MPFHADGSLLDGLGVLLQVMGDNHRQLAGGIRCLETFAKTQSSRLRGQYPREEAAINTCIAAFTWNSLASVDYELNVHGLALSNPASTDPQFLADTWTQAEMRLYEKLAKLAKRAAYATAAPTGNRPAAPRTLRTEPTTLRLVTGPDGPCRRFNVELCTLESCRYTHTCIACSKDHPLSKCPSATAEHKAIVERIIARSRPTTA